MNLKNYVTNLLGIIFWVIAIKKVWITEHPNILFFIILVVVGAALFLFENRTLKKIIHNIIQLLITKINKNSSNIDTEMIEKFIDHKVFKIKVLEGSNYEIKNARLTLDYKEDYEMLSKVRDLCGNFTPRKKINDFLKKNRNILNINFFRNEDWEKKQKVLLKI